MKTTDIRMAGIVTALFLAAANCFAAPPRLLTPDPWIWTLIWWQRLEKKTKQAVAQNAALAQGKAPPGAKGDCGSVNINSNDKKSNSGIKDMFGKQSTTIVTGPVINMANCK